MPRSVALLCVVAFAALIAPASARAGCCVVRKLDHDVPSVTLRLCVPTSATTCGETLYEGLIHLGEAQSVCTPGDTLLYQEDVGGGFGPVVAAICDGADVEI